jgi:hypothetical protein
MRQSFASPIHRLSERKLVSLPSGLGPQAQDNLALSPFRLNSLAKRFGSY